MSHEVIRSVTDEAELAWWRYFQTKFGPDDAPVVGSALLGYRLRLQVEADGGWIAVDGHFQLRESSNSE